VDALCDIFDSLSDRPDLVGAEWWFRLPGGGGQRVELPLRLFFVALCFVDPPGDDGWVRSGF
jgi:hypothetical protein